MKKWLQVFVYRDAGFYKRTGQWNLLKAADAVIVIAAKISREIRIKVYSCIV